MSMLATQRVRLLNRSCDQLRFQTGRDPTTTPLNSYHETAEMKKFRTHHSTLSSQATVVEIDMKNIEPTYFLDCDVVKSIIQMRPVNFHSTIPNIRALMNWMKLNQGHFYYSETTLSVVKKNLPSFITLQRSELQQGEKEKLLTELEFLLPVPQKCILELIEASWIKSNALSTVRPKELQTPLLIKPIDTVCFLTKDERLFNYLMAKQDVRQCINEILQKYKIEDLVRILPLSSLDLKCEVSMTE